MKLSEETMENELKKMSDNNLAKILNKSLKELNESLGDGAVDREVPKAIHRLVEKITKANLWLYILRLLQEKPRYGYEVKNKIKEKFGFSPAIVSGYVILYKMKKDNLVTVKWEQSDEKNQNSGKPNRKYYYITDLGLQTMEIAKKYLGALLQEIFDRT